MFRGIVLPTLGILVAGGGIGLLFNAVRAHDQIEIGRTYFTQALPPGPSTGTGNGAGNDNGGPPPIDPAAAADLERRAGAEFTLVNAIEARRLLDASQEVPGRVLFIDAREDSLFENAHIPFAVQLDYYNIRRYIELPLPFLRRASWLVVYCESSDCEDGLLLCRMLRDEYGIPTERLVLYLGGMREWRELRMPTIVIEGAR